MKTFVRHLVAAAAVAVAAATAGTAGATPFHPASQGLPYTQMPAAAVQDAPTCQRGLLCYTPQMIRDAYDFPHGNGGPTGAGQTIVVVDAYGSPFLGADVAAFDSQFGLDAPDFVEFDQQNVIAPVGSNAFGNWALETTLDVEWAHATAPGAKIVLAVAANDDTSNLVEVQREVLAQYPSAIVVESFGGDESGPASDPDAMSALDQLFATQNAHGGTVVAASGDYGATNNTPYEFETPFAVASYPASSPLVLAVGGTEGNPYPGGLWNHGHYGGEQVWNEVLPGAQPGSVMAGASGGGPSSFYPQPIWQAGIAPSGGRAEPDVAFNAASNGGVIISFGGQFGVIGGTSAGAPQWAGIIALANELRTKARRSQVGLVTPLLYLLAGDRSTYRQDFHDITQGSNEYFGPDSGMPGFAAGPGYDYPTGLGTPDVSRLIKDLAGRDALRLRLTDLLRPHGHGNGHVQFGPGR